jgi:hypothetical protein
MDNSHLFGEAVWPGGSVVLMVLGGSLIALALYSSGVSTRELFSRCNICVELKHRVTHSRIGKALTRKDQDDEHKEG